MDVSILQHELELLPAEQQDRLAAFLTVLRLKRSGMMNELQRRLDDQDPDNWFAWETAKLDVDLPEEENKE